MSPSAGVRTIRVHVRAHPGGWGVFLAGALIAEGQDSAEAELAAREYLRREGGGDMVLHFADRRAPKLIALREN